MLLKNNQPRRSLMNDVAALAGDVGGALDRMTHLCRLGRYRIDEPRFSDDDIGLAGNDQPNLGRTSRYVDGGDLTLDWNLPSPGP